MCNYISKSIINGSILSLNSHTTLAKAKTTPQESLIKHMNIKTHQKTIPSTLDSDCYTFFFRYKQLIYFTKPLTLFIPTKPSIIFLANNLFPNAQ